MLCVGGRLDFFCLDDGFLCILLDRKLKCLQVARTLINLMVNVNKVQTVRYVLTMIDDLLYVSTLNALTITSTFLQEDSERIRMFWALAKQLKQTPWQSFLQMLTRDDGFVVNQASRIIAKLACWSGADNLMTGNDLITYISFLKEQLRAPNNLYVQTSARCLQMLLRIDRYRITFQQQDGVQT